MCLKLCKSIRIKLDNKNIIIRRPKLSDLKSLLRFVNSIAEDDLMVNTNRKFTFNEEKKWLKDSLNKIRKNKLHLLVADHDDEIVADVSLTKKDFRESHVAMYGIMIKRGYRSMGLGTVLTKAILEIAKEDPEIKILYLDVNVINKIALGLYKKLGFRKVARLSKRAFYKGKYVDKFIMDYPLNKI